MTCPKLQACRLNVKLVVSVLRRGDVVGATRLATLRIDNFRRVVAGKRPVEVERNADVSYDERETHGKAAGRGAGLQQY